MRDYSNYKFFSYTPNVFLKVHVHKDGDLDPKDSQEIK
jgi:hypothetical protein